MIDSRPSKTQCRIFTPFVLALVLSAVAATASAQAVQQVDLSAGYLNVSGTMHGANAQVAARVSQRFSIVGEFDMSRGADCDICEPEYRDKAWLVGGRMAWQPTRRYSPFAQVLVGGLQSSYDDYLVPLCCGLPDRLERAATVDYLAFQPGGGLTAMITPRFGVQSQVDLQFASADRYEGISIFPRVVVGGVLRLGRR